MNCDTRNNPPTTISVKRTVTTISSEERSVDFQKWPLLFGILPHHNDFLAGNDDLMEFVRRRPHRLREFPLAILKQVSGNSDVGQAGAVDDTDQNVLLPDVQHIDVTAREEVMRRFFRSLSRRERRRIKRLLRF